VPKTKQKPETPSKQTPEIQQKPIELKTENIIEVLGDEKTAELIREFTDNISEVCLKEFKNIDGNRDIKNKSQAKENFVKEKFELRIDEIKIEGVDDDAKRREIRDRIKKRIDYSKMTEFIVGRDKIDKEREKNKKEREEWEQLERDIENTKSGLTKRESRGAVELFKGFVNDFELAINNVYDDKEIKKIKNAKKKQQKIEEKIKAIEEKYKIRIKNGSFYLSDKTKGNQEKIKTLLENIKTSIEKKRSLDGKEADTEKAKNENIKELSEAFGLDPKSEEPIKVMESILSGKGVDEKILGEITKEMKKKEKGKFIKGIKKCGKVAGMVGAGALVGGGLFAGGIIAAIIAALIKEFKGK